MLVLITVDMSVVVPRQRRIVPSFEEEKLV